MTESTQFTLTINVADDEALFKNKYEIEINLTKEIEEKEEETEDSDEDEKEEPSEKPEETEERE